VLGVLVVLAVWLGWRMWPASEPGVVAGAAEVPGDAVLQSPEVPERPETPQASGAPGGSSVEPEGAVAPGEPEPTRSEPVTPEPPRTAGEPEPARDGGATGTIEAATEKKEVAPRALTEEAFKRRLRGALDDCRSTTDDASVKVRAQVKAGRLGALEVVEAVGLSPLKVDCVKTKLPDLRSTSVAFTTRELKVKLPRRS
jgi:hypothetical protein